MRCLLPLVIAGCFTGSEPPPAAPPTVTPPAPPPVADQTPAWKWATSTTPCRDIWRTGYACDGGAVVWRACSNLPRPVDYVASGKRYRVRDMCFDCPRAPSDPAPSGDPRGGSCAAERSQTPHYDPNTGALMIDGYRWEPIRGGWSVTPPRPPGLPIGADMVGYMCKAKIIPGSVDPQTCRW